jgi:hypothetical protein
MLSTNSTLDVIPAKLANVALMQLYSPDDSDRLTLYSQYYGNTYLIQCANHAIAPAATHLQSELSKMAPTARILRLYVSGSSNPTHYIVLRRKTLQDPWTINRRRLCEATSPLKDGVFIRWPNSDPYAAIMHKPTLTRLFGGGSIAAPLLIDEIASIPELYRELSLSILAASLCIPGDEFSVWTKPGKVVYRVDPHTHNPYLLPLNLTLLRRRPYAQNITKPKCIIWADCPPDAMETAADLPRHIVPQIKGLTPHPFDWDDFQLASLIREPLMARLLPFLGVIAKNRVTLYGLSYDPIRREPFTAVYQTNRMLKTSKDLPLVMRIANPDKPYVPNSVLISIVKHHLTCEDQMPPSTAFINRFLAMRFIMHACGYHTIPSYIQAFRDWNDPLDSTQITRVKTYAVYFGESDADHEAELDVAVTDSDTENLKS